MDLQCRNKNISAASPMETTICEGDARLLATNEARIPICMELRWRWWLCKSTHTYIILTFCCANHHFECWRLGVGGCHVLTGVHLLQMSTTLRSAKYRAKKTIKASQREVWYTVVWRETVRKRGAWKPREWSYLHCWVRERKKSRNQEDEAPTLRKKRPGSLHAQICRLMHKPLYLGFVVYMLIT